MSWFDQIYRCCSCQVIHRSYTDLTGSTGHAQKKRSLVGASQSRFVQKLVVDLDTLIALMSWFDQIYRCCPCQVIHRSYTDLTGSTGHAQKKRSLVGASQSRFVPNLVVDLDTLIALMSWFDQIYRSCPCPGGTITGWRFPVTFFLKFGCVRPILGS